MSSAVRAVVRASWLVVLLVACSRSPESPAPSGAAAMTQVAAQRAALYEQMRAVGNFEVAQSLGEEILQRYADTPAAAAVARTIGEVRRQAANSREARRLAQLWSYAAVAVAGGTQYTAVIESEQPPTPTGRARLVLREHPQWGQSVYLLLDGARFDCTQGCSSLAATFDDTPVQRLSTTVPRSGEPALFIDDDRGFLARLGNARIVTIEASIAGIGPRRLVFEVAGFDPHRLPRK